jgi:hypothetical protein
VLETEAAGEGDEAADSEPSTFDAVAHAVSDAEAQPETIELGVGEIVLSTVGVVLTLGVPLSVRSREGEAPKMNIKPRASQHNLTTRPGWRSPRPRGCACRWGCLRARGCRWALRSGTL